MASHCPRDPRKKKKKKKKKSPEKRPAATGRSLSLPHVVRSSSAAYREYLCTQKKPERRIEEMTQPRKEKKVKERKGKRKRKEERKKAKQQRERESESESQRKVKEKNPQELPWRRLFLPSGPALRGDGVTEGGLFRGVEHPSMSTRKKSEVLPQVISG